MKYDVNSRMAENWRKIIDYGPRPYGSANLRRCGEYIRTELEKINGTAELEIFPARTWDVKLIRE